MSSKANVTIACIPPDLIGQFWPLIGPSLLKGTMAIERSMSRTLKDLGECILRISQGLAQAWIVAEDDSKRILAAMISEITTDDAGRRVVFVSRMGGEEISQWGHALSERMAEFAAAEGCEAVLFYGRPALERAYTGVKVIGKHASGAFLYERAA